jgi:mannitol-1-/sugar-/sorbitol-6-phosphatase
MSIVCDAIIFDLDGVLADSNIAVERHLRIWADRHGIAFERVLEVHHGRRTVETLALLAPGIDAEAEALLIEEDAADDTEGVVAFAGATRLLQGLPAGRWAIATSGTSRIARNRVAHLGFPVPPVFVTADDVSAGKPAPDPYLLAAARLGVDPSRCVVVEDAPAGVEAALAAGARVIGVAATLPADLLMAAHVVVSHLDLLEIVSRAERLEVTWREAVRSALDPDDPRAHG